MKKILVTVSTIIFYSFCRGQSVKDSSCFIKGTLDFAVSNILYIDTMMVDCMGTPVNSYALTLYSDNPEDIKSMQPGVIECVLNIEDEQLLIVRTNDYFICYSGLFEPQVKAGDSVVKGKCICSLVKVQTDSLYELNLSLFSKTTNQLNINRWFDWTKFSYQQIPNYKKKK